MQVSGARVLTAVVAVGVWACVCESRPQQDQTFLDSLLNQFPTPNGNSIFPSFNSLTGSTSSNSAFPFFNSLTDITPSNSLFTPLSSTGSTATNSNVLGNFADTTTGFFQGASDSLYRITNNVMTSGRDVVNRFLDTVNRNLVIYG
ncbi:hypothetical protein OTU49_005245 [Cherax quadricarinatus]|uniref:Uncharacterized protein n=1 Tax=Cherax quadricarinatus TaxID=27406 RepID=A0AAW0X7L9_CHEQU|nr:uncharacterized protein LOC128696644 [Cherax quadricarinatus]XP_053643941.1 uncharacterized protein LOC128696644 [Cherax quadricarinatus]XP_053643942.1 uncharacterized protein LOC128696644 [Cherax quadricarinatus]